MNMRKYIIIILSALLIVVPSCQKKIDNSGPRKGTLSFADFSLSIDETIALKSSASQEQTEYYIFIYDHDENEVLKTTYTEIQSSLSDIELRAGVYTLSARTIEENVPEASFDSPVYGITQQITINPGEVTRLGSLVCTLLQCKVTISYTDEFLEMVTGSCSVEVSVVAGHSLSYNLEADGSYEQRAGYFAVHGHTMTVIFKGSINGKSQKQTKYFTDIAPQQWRQIKFIPKINTQGDATIDIVIDPLLDDEPLNIVSKVEEEILGTDPDAPKGDGGITLIPDYEAGCDPEISDLMAVRILPMDTPMSIKLKAIVPSGIKKFTVDISTDSQQFSAAVDAASAKHLDLINPLPENMIIFDVVPFPYGQELLGQTEVAFDLSAAQAAIVVYKGYHRFDMTIVDMEGCKNQIPVVMIVE